MPTLYLVRHGRAAAGWDKDQDPGLDDVGRRQAETAAQALAGCGPLDVVVSPMRRTRDTAAPLLDVLRRQPRIEPRVGEIPSPTPDLVARGHWLRETAARSWSGLDEHLRRWRADLLSALGEMRHDTAIVTHFIAINVAVGAATGDERVVCFHPDYCSVTKMRCSDGELVLLERGMEGTTRVL